MKNRILYSIILTLLLFCCSCSVSEQRCSRAEKRLSKKLTDLNYYLLYADTWYSSKEIMDKIWNRHANRCALVKIINDTSVSTKVRFSAAEILLEKQDSISINNEKKVLAEIYAEAINKNAFGTMNYFGMTTISNIGVSGEHLLKIGETAVPALTKVLDSEEYMHYWGSKYAEVGISWRYRAKDVAAFYIFKIRKQKFEWPISPQERDKVIADLKESLKHE